jgi:uncharacterized RmlC-like cupin family protein
MTEQQCQLVKASTTFSGKQGLNYFHGVSAESVGARGLCMHLMRIPPGARANAHLHEGHESVVYVISGRARMLHGHQLEQVMECEAGDLLYIPAGVPHRPENASDTEECVAVLARTDPNEQESVVLRPDLDEAVAARQ